MRASKQIIRRKVEFSWVALDASAQQTINILTSNEENSLIKNPHNYTSFYAFFHITFCVPLKQQSFTNFHHSLLALDVSFLSFTYFLFSFFPLAHKHTHSSPLFLLLIYIFKTISVLFTNSSISNTGSKWEKESEGFVNNLFLKWVQKDVVEYPPKKRSL